MFTFRNLLIVIFLGSVYNAFAQMDGERCWELDYGMYPRMIEVGGDPKDAFPNGAPTPPKALPKLTKLTEANVTFRKRVWSSIELGASTNRNLAHPADPKPNRWSLWTVIRYGLEVDQSLTAYDPGISQDDSFNDPIHPTDSNYCDRLRNVLYKETYVDSLDELGEPIYDSLTEENLQKKIWEPIRAEHIIRYLIKEDWVFDSERSTMEKRIIGIAPVVESFDEYGDIRGYKVLFWLYFPQCEFVFQNFVAYDRQVEPSEVTYTDLFRKRQFSSIIVMESNTSNSSLNSNPEALRESLQIKKRHDNLEHDLWSY